MPTLAFLPWLRLDKRYEIDNIVLVPFSTRQPVASLDNGMTECVKHIMASYKRIDGQPVDRAALVHFVDRSPVDALKRDDIHILQEFVDLACFCGLVRRDCFEAVGYYCNSDNFQLRFQRFDNADSTAIEARRRCMRTASFWPIEEVTISIPTNCITTGCVNLDETLLRALVDHRANSKKEWGRWLNAISCFNQANTDNDTMRPQVEWVLLCSAFEHLLGARSNARNVARRFSEEFVPHVEIRASMANREAQWWKQDGQALRCEWMAEFYRIRGDYAHGNLQNQQHMAWTHLEHLCLATIAFPLLVKCMLNKAGRYALTWTDRSQVSAFERFADTRDFLEPPADRQHPGDSHWSRLCTEEEDQIRYAELKGNMEEQFPHLFCDE